ncbi:hypothetical protein AeMF1_012096 [Aphanomyces euteiches]|nr:hypothetical protein AeMF1_012096 [Aphanomyces euteiches]KAH9185119.1 hypothetical protein AeNC1_012907 [Aphanomyces euteiches]
MNIVALVIKLAAVATSTMAALNLSETQKQLSNWFDSPAGQSATKLQAVPPNSLNNETVLARFAAAIHPAEAALVNSQPLVDAWVNAYGARPNTSSSTTVYLSAASSTESLYTIACADPMCLTKVNTSATTPQLYNPLVLLSPTEVANFAQAKLTTGGVQASLASVGGEIILLLQVSTA